MTQYRERALETGQEREGLTHNSEQVCDGSLQHTVLKQLEKGQKLTFYVLFVKQNHVM